MKRRFDWGEASSILTMTWNQVTHTLATITTVTTASKTHVKQHSKKGFEEVKTQLQYFINAILEKVPEANVLQRTGELSIGKKVRLVQIMLRVLETINENVDASLEQFQTIAFDVNELPTHTLVWLQKLGSQEVINREKSISDHLYKSQDWEELTKQEIERLRKEQDILIVEKAQLWDDRPQLEKYVAFSC